VLTKHFEAPESDYLLFQNASHRFLLFTTLV